MKVTIIIPVYNVVAYLSEALESVIHQSYTNLEIIVIDDGSTDGSDIICDKYEQIDDRVRVIHQQNKGLSAARNLGLDLNTGDVITFLDSDDAYHPDYIKNMVYTMKQENTDIVICKCLDFFTGSNMKYSKPVKIHPSIKMGKYSHDIALRALIDKRINNGVWNKIYAKDLWNEIRFPVGHVYEDIDTTYKVLNLCGSVYVIDLPMYFHRIRRGSITTTHSENNINDKIRALLHFNKFVEVNTPALFSESQLNTVKNNLQNQLFSGYLRYEGDDNEYLEGLRCWIIENSKGVYIKKQQVRTMVCCFLLRICPKVLKFIYPYYSVIKQRLYLCGGLRCSRLN